jgi:hypothetical protein
MNIILTLLAVTLLQPANGARDGAIGAQVCRGGDTASCAFIVGAERDLTHMLLTADPAPLIAHLDDGVVWTLPNGISLTKVQMIDAVRRDTPKAVARMEGLTVTFFGETAIATWAESWTNAGDGGASERMVGTDTWVRRGGKWKLVGLQESRPQAGN